MRRTALVTGAIVVTLFGHSPAAAALDDPPPPNQVVIDVVSAFGSGCLPGTVEVTVAPDNTSFSLTYHQYVARVGVGAGQTDFRKTCHISMRTVVPEGYTYAIARSEFHGYASLAKGATGMQRASYYFSGLPTTSQRTHSFTGPLEDNWQTADEFDPAEMVFHPCGTQRNLNITTELRLADGTSDPVTTTSFLAMSSSASTTYFLKWKPCS